LTARLSNASWAGGPDAAGGGVPVGAAGAADSEVPEVAGGVDSMTAPRFGVDPGMGFVMPRALAMRSTTPYPASRTRPTYPRTETGRSHSESGERRRALTVGVDGKGIVVVTG
jgi:hypothetical protein